MIDHRHLLFKAAGGALEGIVAKGAAAEVAATGFLNTEGPVWGPDGLLYFTDNRRSQILRFGSDDRAHVWRENTQGANGLAIDQAERLIAALGIGRRIVAFEKDGSVTTLADEYRMQPFLRPNDLTAGTSGSIYFTDPGLRRAAPQGGRPAVYHLPFGGEVARIAEDITRPNGILLSPDEKTLYVADSLGEDLLAFDVQPDGSVRNRRAFARLRGVRKTPEGVDSGADGMAVDRAGRLYAASLAGIQVFSPRGEPLGAIPVPKQPRNLTFGGPEKKTLWITAGDTLYRLKMEAQGLANRAK